MSRGGKGVQRVQGAAGGERTATGRKRPNGAAGARAGDAFAGVAPFRLIPGGRNAPYSHPMTPIRTAEFTLSIVDAFSASRTSTRWTTSMPWPTRTSASRLRIAKRSTSEWRQRMTSFAQAAGREATATARNPPTADWCHVTMCSSSAVVSHRLSPQYSGLDHARSAAPRT